MSKLTTFPSICPRWDSPLVDLFFSNQYLQITTAVPSTSVYGFGEQEHVSFKHSMDFATYSMFSRDQAPTVIHFGRRFVLALYYKAALRQSSAQGVHDNIADGS